MASAVPSFRFTKENTNYARLCRLLIDVGTQVVRETFDRVRLRGNLSTVLADPSVQSILNNLLKRRVLNATQWEKLYPPGGYDVSSKDFDITLLMVLLQHICNLRPPTTGWGKVPPGSDISIEADLVRIRMYRNHVYSHAPDASVDDALFNAYWQDIQAISVRVGGPHYLDAIDKLRTDPMDPAVEERYQGLLKQWVKDEESIKDKLDDVAERLSGQLEGLKESIISNLNPERRSRVEDDKLQRIIWHMEDQLQNVFDKMSAIATAKEEIKDEEKITEKFQQMENQMKNVSEKLDALMAPKEEIKEEENVTEKLQQMENQIRNVSEKFDTLVEEMRNEDQRRALSLGSSQSAEGSACSISRVQSHEIAVNPTQGNPGSTTVNSLMHANINPLASGSTSAVFAGANIGTLNVGSFHVYHGNVTLHQSDQNRQITETDRDD